MTPGRTGGGGGAEGEGGELEHEGKKEVAGGVGHGRAPERMIAAKAPDVHPGVGGVASLKVLVAAGDVPLSAATDPIRSDGDLGPGPDPPVVETPSG
jgi:hypothetical protein